MVINMGHIVPDVPAAEAGKQSSDTLFGPSIGVVAGGPDWTDSIDSEKDEELTPDIVKAWIAKSKEVSLCSFVSISIVCLLYLDRLC